MNLAIADDDDTVARTCPEAAVQRAQRMYDHGITSVMELCVGPSLRQLHLAYRQKGIFCCGVDIDVRWKNYAEQWNLQNEMIVSDALRTMYHAQAVVFAPPVSRGCTGKREDMLRIDEVGPRYLDFLAEYVRQRCCGISRPQLAVLVLPARSTRGDRIDREQFNRLRSDCYEYADHVETFEIKVGRRQITKYVELWLS
ncbi:MAG TPA: hypothetical protein VFT74_05445 [Isosphaeraceae bacterium]|nr:hypothetical protein [Isosphaeraceae bacterium]